MDGTGHDLGSNMGKRKADGKFIRKDTTGVPGDGERPKHQQKFTMLFQQPLLDLLTGDGRPTPSELRVLLVLMGLMTYRNLYDQPLHVIATQLGVHRTAVSLAMRGLTRRGLVLATPKRGRPTTYQVSADLCWRGDVIQRKAARAKTPAPAGRGVTQLPLFDAVEHGQAEHDQAA